MHDFRRRHVWRMARELGTEIYSETAKASRPVRRMLYSLSESLPAEKAAAVPRGE